MRQYGSRRHGNDMGAKDAGQPSVGGAPEDIIPALTDPGLAALTRAVCANTAAVIALTEQLARRETVEATATIAGETVRLEVRT